MYIDLDTNHCGLLYLVNQSLSVVYFTCNFYTTKCLSIYIGISMKHVVLVNCVKPSNGYITTRDNITEKSM